MKRLLLTLLVIAGIPTSAFAAEYHIFQGIDKRCRVVDIVPNEVGAILSGPSGFATREAAAAELPKICKQDQVQQSPVQQSPVQQGPAQQGPVAGQTYLIFQGMVDKRCRIVDTVPKEIGVILGGPSGFATRAEAEAWLSKLCEKAK